jgi:hypothetical protein
LCFFGQGIILGQAEELLKAFIENQEFLLLEQF